jgi:hypothetical protein
MATKAERIRILELGLEEQRRDYDVLNAAYETARVKNITFLAAALALLAFLYANNKGSTLREKLFIPHESYGVIIYALSFGTFVFSVAVLLMALKPQRWSTAFENNQEDSVAQDHEEYLVYMKRRYIACSNVNSGSYAKKQGLLDLSLIPLIAGGIILLVLKTFGG